MSAWKIFSKPKDEDVEESELETSKFEEYSESDDMEEANEVVEETSENNQTLTEYHETLHSEKERLKKGAKYKRYIGPSDQRVWRDINSIEEEIDKLHLTQARKPSSDLERRVDKVIYKKKSRSASNVIYVVNKPQPGQVRGDWAVRGHGKIYSHHRKKDNAIKQARKIAREKQATVMVQNTDGTFGDSFKPRPKK